MAIPRATNLASTGQSRWTRRLARGGDSCQPSAASSGGFAAAPLGLPPVTDRSPTTRSRTTRKHRRLDRRRCRRQLIQEEQAVTRSRQASRPEGRCHLYRNHRSHRAAQRKSAGSRIDPITISVGHPSDSRGRAPPRSCPFLGCPKEELERRLHTNGQCFAYGTRRRWLHLPRHYLSLGRRSTRVVAHLLRGG